jgi:hypothetical protein
MEQHVRETAPETLQRPQKLTSRRKAILLLLRSRSWHLNLNNDPSSLARKETQRLCLCSPFLLECFVRKDVSAPDVRLPEKTIQLDDALQRINTETPEEGPASVVIEGPASSVR